jgi:branched-chain amino acid transport system substrate-binding protein
MTRAAAILLTFAFAAAAQAPYKDKRESPMRYEGPGREEPEPSGLREVRIGYFGPSDAAHPLGGTFWVGAERALEEANRAGGYKGLPFRLVQSWTDDPWRAGAAAVVRMAYQDRVWAVIAGIDGVTAHLAEQVAAKALVPMIDPGSTDKTVNYANVPWTFSLLPADPAYAAAIAESAPAQVVVLSATDHDSRAIAGDFLAELRKRQIAPRRHVEFAAGAADAAQMASECAALGPRAVVVLASPADCARLVRELRRAAPALTIFGGPAMARQSFRELAGAAAAGVRYPVPGAGDPDYAAGAGYDAVRLVFEAIRRAGLNRARIRDAIAELSPWQGVSGEIRWNGQNRNSRAVTVTARPALP